MQFNIDLSVTCFAFADEQVLPVINELDCGFRKR